MKLIKTLLLPVLFVAMWSLTGCNEEPTTSVTPDTTPGLSKLTLPDGAVISSATFNIRVEDATNNGHDVHQVNVDWDELIETWTIFYGKTAPQYNAAVLGSFNSVSGWQSVDITALVQGWVDGSIPNYGVLINQPLTGAGFSTLRSREYNGGGVSDPYLEVTYTVGGGNPVTVQEPAYGDTYIWNVLPDDNFGTEQYVRVANLATSSYIKQALIKFDIEEAEVNCETAYAYGEGASLQTLCFLDIPNVQGANWGWTNQIGPGTYNWPIYAGAGQCDITKGTLVGNLNVVYAAGTATITFQPDAGVTFGDFHVWVGTNGNMLPSRNGKWITSPGSYNHKGMNPVVVNGLGGNIWIAAHVGEACF